MVTSATSGGTTQETGHRVSRPTALRAEPLSSQASISRTSAGSIRPLRASRQEEKSEGVHEIQECAFR